LSLRHQPNGSVLVSPFNEGRGPDTLAQHFEDHTFEKPLNIVVVDHYGEAARVVIRSGEISYQELSIDRQARSAQRWPGFAF
jgi:hypothetical protein